MSKVRLLFAEVAGVSPMGMTITVRVLSDDGEDIARFDFQTIDGELYKSTGELWADLSEVQEFEKLLKSVRGENARILYAEPETNGDLSKNAL